MFACAAEGVSFLIMKFEVDRPPKVFPSPGWGLRVSKSAFCRLWAAFECFGASVSVFGMFRGLQGLLA